VLRELAWCSFTENIRLRAWIMHAALLTLRRCSMFEGIFQPTHLLLIFGIALLVFGPKKLPELGKGIGAGIRALKEGIKDPLIEPGKSGSAEPVASNDSNSN